MKDNKIHEKIKLQLENTKKKQNLRERGITLIALVVTIIILLILVGVTISQITGENGLIRKAKEAIERYKNAAEEEQIQLGQLEQYVSDFSIVGGDEGEKATISIKSLELTGNTAEQQIIVKVTVKGEASGVEYKINSEEEWTAKENEGTEKEGIDGEKETEYTHTFEELEIGKSYYVRVKVYDTNGKYEEAISDVVTLGYIMTAEDGDVLKGRTYIGKTGTKSTGSMPNNGEVNETIEVGEKYDIQKGYYSGGTITTGTKKIEELEKRIEELEVEDVTLTYSLRRHTDGANSHSQIYVKNFKTMIIANTDGNEKGNRTLRIMYNNKTYSIKQYEKISIEIEKDADIVMIDSEGTEAGYFVGGSITLKAN